jgi:hypothetical protein
MSVKNFEPSSNIWVRNMSPPSSGSESIPSQKPAGSSVFYLLYVGFLMFLSLKIVPIKYQPDKNEHCDEI